MKHFLQPLLAIVSVSVIAFSGASALGQTQETQTSYMNKWISSEKEMAADPSTRGKFFQTFEQPASADEITAAQKFLMDRISKGVTDFGYHQAYSRLAWTVGSANNKTSTKNSAAILAAAAVLILETDMSHCKKPSGKSVYIDTITSLKEPLYYLQIMDASTRVKMLNEAMKFEEKIANRPGNPLVCLKTNKQGMIEYLKKDEWLEERREIRKGFQRSLMPRE